MPIAPDPPFPKVAGNPIRSKDWNDLVTEVQRLDTAKVNRAGDAMTGPLTIAAALGQAALGVGTATPAARLHVVDSSSPTVLRVQSTAAFGAARVELWSDPQGSGSEWRPGYIQSFDLGNFTGGLAFVTNGSTQANRQASLEAMRAVNGKVAVGGGIPNPDYRFEVSDRIRLREGPNGTAGLWLYQNQNTAGTMAAGDRAFVGIAGDTSVGFWGQTGAAWGLVMDTTTGNVGIRQYPAGAGGAALTVNGRIRDARVPMETRFTNQVPITTNWPTQVSPWNTVPNMTQTVPVAVLGWYLIRFRMNGVQVVGGNGVVHTHGNFRMLLDGGQIDFTREEWHANGWELRGVELVRLVQLGPGNHTIEIQWQVGMGEFPIGGTVTMTGCWYNDTRSIITIEL